MSIVKEPKWESPASSEYILVTEKRRLVLSEDIARSEHLLRMPTERTAPSVLFRDLEASKRTIVLPPVAMFSVKRYIVFISGPGEVIN